MRPATIPLRRATGSALILALLVIVALALMGVFLVKLAGSDRVEAAKVGVKDRGVACAEAGLQYGRRFFGTRYETSNNWNTYLAAGSGYSYVPGAAKPDLGSLPMQARGKSDGAAFDAGADLDGDGQPDFWVSIHDDDDERPLGIADNPNQDNNETIILRSECTNPAWAVVQGGVAANAVLEAYLTHIQGSSGYATASQSSNAMDLVGRPR
jgi:hypothetical protein